MKKIIAFAFMMVYIIIVSAQNSEPYKMRIYLKDGSIHYPTEQVDEVLFAKQKEENIETSDNYEYTDSYTAISVNGMTSEFSNASESEGRSEILVRLSGITMQAIGGTTPANDENGHPCVNADGEVWKWNAVNWDEKLQSDINFYYILGTGNPYTAIHAEEIVTNDKPTGFYRLSYNYYQPDGSNGLPISGLYYKFTPKYNGKLKIGIWSNKNNRRTFVVEESSMRPVSYQTEGYINGQNDTSGKKRYLSNEEISTLHDTAGVGNYVIGNGNFFWGWITVTVEAGKNYYLFQDSSQIGFQGFTFTYKTDGSDIHEESSDYTMRILQQMGESCIPTNEIVEITFNKNVESTITTGSSILEESISAIPESYLEKAVSRGNVIGLKYNTTSYITNQQIEKIAYIYLPWEYEYYPDRKYNILYLMHGMGDDATTYIYGNTKELRMILDHMIQDSIIDPLIVVTPTFYDPEGGNTNIGQAAVAFPNELLNDLMPAVESKYRTYAQTADLDGFRASREHRAFGGFSMGSVTTWNVFSKALPYISDYIPMSGGMNMITGNGNVATSLATIVEQTGLGKHDFYINAMSGSEDYAAGGLESQISQMASCSPFVLSRKKEEGNIYYRSWFGGKHDYNACVTYVYNALYNLFR